MVIHVVSCVIQKQVEQGMSILNPVYILERETDDELQTYKDLLDLLTHNPDFDGYEICTKQIIKYEPNKLKIIV